MKVKMIDHGMPIGLLKHLRREQAEKWINNDDDVPPTEKEIQWMAALQGAIAACEAVRAEMDAE